MFGGYTENNPPINKIGGITMNFLSITSSDDMWKEVSQFAQNCSWRAGKSLSQRMSDNTFSDWERVMVALHKNDIAGYCTVAKAIAFQIFHIRLTLVICSLARSIGDNA